MNIIDLNNKIYGYKDLKQGEYVDSIMEYIEEQEILSINLNNYSNDINSDLGRINKEIKF